MVSENSDAVGRSALRKAYWRLVPLIAVGYGAAYVDRVNVSFASISMNRDLHFSPAIYGTGAGLFFVSYALCEIPSNLLLVRFGARRWLARIMATWAVLAMGMLLVRTAPQFYTMRLLLGMAEAGFFPGVCYYLTEWFPPGERARAISRFYIALPLSSTVMGSLAGWLLGLDGHAGLRGWQWLFLVEGLPPLLLAGAFYWLLPDAPRDAKWLTAEERGWLEARSGAGRVSEGHGWRDFVTTMQDGRMWVVALFFLCILTVLYAWSFSAPVILQGLTGWTVGQVGWLIAGMGLLGAVGMLWNARRSDRTGERIWHIAVPMGLMTAGFAIGASTGKTWVAVPCFALTIVAYNAAQGPVLALPAAFLSGRASAIGYAAITAIGVAGGFIGPYWMGRAREWTGGYQRGLLTLAAPSLVAGLLVLSLKKAKIAPHAVEDGEIGAGVAEA